MYRIATGPSRKNMTCADNVFTMLVLIVLVQTGLGVTVIMDIGARNLSSGSPTKQNSNQTVQLQIVARILKLCKTQG